VYSVISLAIDQFYFPTRFNQETKPYKMSLVGEVNYEFEEWLNKSLVCTSNDPRDLATVASTINNGFGLCSKTYALTSFKFIPTFPTMQN